MVAWPGTRHCGPRNSRNTPSGHCCVDRWTYGLPANNVARVTKAFFRFAEVDCVTFGSQSSDGSGALSAGTAFRLVTVNWVACWIPRQQVLLCTLVQLLLDIQMAASADLDAASFHGALRSAPTAHGGNMAAELGLRMKEIDNMRAPERGMPRVRDRGMRRGTGTEKDLGLTTAGPQGPFAILLRISRRVGRSLAEIARRCVRWK